MITKFFTGMFGGTAKEAQAIGQPAASEGPAPQAREADAPRPQAEAPDEVSGFFCRETILGRDQRVAGYHFLLHEAARNRIHGRSRRVHHAYAELLVRTVAQMDAGQLLGDRLAFLDLPDSFLDHPCLGTLPPASTVFIVTPLADDAPPRAEAVRASVARLRQAGYRVAQPAPATPGEADDDLLEQADFVVVRAASADPERLRALAQALAERRAKATIFARELPSHDDFQLCYTLGATHFHGPFLTQREEWRGNRLGPNTARLADMLARLRRDADTAELVALLKEDAALSVRLMRYINSAAVGLREPISSIEHALLQLGRDRLCRWLMLLLYGADKTSPRSAAVLENALVRARLMELLGQGRDAAEADALFLVGLLSLLDVVLQVPMDEAMASIAAAPAIEAAVVRGEGPMADLLRLAVACESDAPDALAAAAARCAISPALASRRHLEAFAWALDVNG